ncbi:hypothetical protein AVEN_266504-1 [Araneus ventricosus]|uniref:Uncharacterized protein n=1 Tax=Araneus ventricosus TaxID=182803 RepID=A0A4Y2I385_ARAVE|nr:hypothetical protein AVEN_266504-1 [Araneus ventricosus]
MLEKLSIPLFCKKETMPALTLLVSHTNCLKKTIVKMERPAISPDINLNRCVSRVELLSSVPPQTLHGRRTVSQDHWRFLPMQLIDSALNSTRHSFQACIDQS